MKAKLSIFMLTGKTRNIEGTITFIKENWPENVNDFEIEYQSRQLELKTNHVMNNEGDLIREYSGNIIDVKYEDHNNLWESKPTKTLENLINLFYDYCHFDIYNTTLYTNMSFNKKKKDPYLASLLTTIGIENLSATQSIIYRLIDILIQGSSDMRSSYIRVHTIDNAIAKEIYYTIVKYHPFVVNIISKIVKEIEKYYNKKQKEYEIDFINHLISIGWPLKYKSKVEDIYQVNFNS